MIDTNPLSLQTLRYQLKHTIHRPLSYNSATATGQRLFVRWLNKWLTTY